MAGFGLSTGVAVGYDGSVDPHSQLFRSSFVGIETGPMVSQVRWNLAYVLSIDIELSLYIYTSLRGVYAARACVFLYYRDLRVCLSTLMCVRMFAAA